MARNSFQYAGGHYNFSVTLSTKGRQHASLEAQTVDCTLDSDKVLDFTYENKMNTLVQSAKLTYIDNSSVIDKYATYQYVAVIVDISRTEIRSDGTSKIQKDVDGEKVKLEFWLDNLEIKDSDAHQITYILHLVSMNSLNLRRITKYTSYGDNKTVTKQISDILTQGGMNFDGKSFETSPSKVEVEYISNGTDTIYDSVKYLQRMEMYGKTSDDRLRMILFNDRNGQYSMFNFSGTFDWQTLRNFKVQMTTNRGTIQSTDDQSKIAFVDNKPNMEMYKSQFPKTLHTYDIESNTFGSVKFTARQIIDIIHGQGGNNRVENEATGNFEITQSYWNNGQNIFMDQIENMIDNSGLKINVPGVVGIIPGDKVNVEICYDLENSTEDAKQSKQEMLKYDSYSGLWNVSRVVYRILPHDCKFRQIISLMREYDKDPLNTDGK